MIIKGCFIFHKSMIAHQMKLSKQNALNFLHIIFCTLFLKLRIEKFIFLRNSAFYIDFFKKGEQKSRAIYFRFIIGNGIFSFFLFYGML